MILNKRIVKFADVAATMTPVFALGVVPVMCEMNTCLRKVMCSYNYTMFGVFL